ncbi:MAG: 3-oxoacid CoA-transferase subunit B [Gammaproteobacteria bacterium]|nr:3-oxoacid CoA-transferase subunit B [Gammaproteobacteria bacterium]MYG96845.1 3-oxoacid CoA-transferase subunit B [Gammaproteobacteria bacterium]
MKNVPVIDAQQAAAKVRSGDRLLVGGFGMTGTPVHLLHALAETGVKDLVFIGNNIGEPGLGGSRLLRNGQVRKAVGSFFTSNPEAVAAAHAGEIEAELIPQGTFSEALRAGGAGLGGFFTPTSAGTLLAEGRETRSIDGREMVFIEPIRGDIAFIRAWRADTAGNLQYRMTENNFNHAIATAAGTVIAEVEEIVPAGEIDADAVHTPGCFVDYLVQAKVRLEHLGVSASIKDSGKKVNARRMAMARAALGLLRRGDVVNLGVGIPTLVADLISPEDGIILHSENGMLGMGPEPAEGGAMEYPVNAGKIPVTALPGASYFDSATSFAMIRGGHIDVAVMGGLQVDQHGNLANWAIPNSPLLGVGGAMDLASGAKRLVVTMTHTNKDGTSKVVESCDLPLTARGAVNVLITELAIFEFDGGGMTLSALMPGSSIEDVKRHTTANYRISDSLETAAAPR